MRLASTRHPLVRSLSRLRQARERRAQGRFLAEGRRLVEGLLAAGWTPAPLLLREDLAAPAGWEDAVRVTPAVVARLSAAATPSGYLACFPLPPATGPDPTAPALVLVGVSDPGNAGTLVRSAAAFGLGQVVLVGGADPFGTKALQASAGAVASVRLTCHPADLPPERLARAVPWIALVARGGAPPPAMGPAWLVVGSEAHGLSAAWRSACDRCLSLPMAPGVESLNAAVAGSIAAFLLAAGGGYHKAPGAFPAAP